MEITRRNLLATGLSGGLGLGLGGCAGIINPIRPTCGNDPRISDPLSPLTIDVHAHVFNGSDLQINGFLTRVLKIPGIGPILQNLGWSEAPSGKRELDELAKVTSALQQCNITSFNTIIDQHREQQYQIGRRQLQESIRAIESRRLNLTAASAAFSQQIKHLPDNYKSYRKSLSYRNGYKTKDITPGGAIDFILQNFQYRYVNVFDYLNEYSLGRRRRVDLITAHLVDYDWPIGCGKSTETDIRDQIRVMSEISILTSGRIHCFAPFDPFKQVAYELGLAPYSPLDVAADAILNRGFIGIKIYPPMGFRPIGNALNPPLWSDGYLPRSILVSDLGQRLDKALSDMYQWCVTNDVPVMAHTAPSNSPTNHVVDLTCPTWWDSVLRTFPGLRINFGHFGGTDVANDGLSRPKALVALMNIGGPGVNAYADSAYFVDSVNNPTQLLHNLQQLLRTTSQTGDAVVADRFMYGTDWEMIIIEGRATNNYLRSFEDIFSTLDSDPTLGSNGRLSDRFFGKNAANFLALHKAGANRNRIEAFYAREGVSAAPLLSKIDSATTLSVRR